MEILAIKLLLPRLDGGNDRRRRRKSRAFFLCVKLENWGCILEVLIHWDLVWIADAINLLFFCRPLVMPATPAHKRRGERSEVGDVSGASRYCTEMEPSFGDAGGSSRHETRLKRRRQLRWPTKVQDKRRRYLRRPRRFSKKNLALRAAPVSQFGEV